MKVPNAVHESRPWRIREIAADFTLLDVWALPVQGDADDFHTLVEQMLSLDPTATPSIASRVLWVAREYLGKWLRLDKSTGESLAGRLPEDLRGTVTDLRFDGAPFTPLYRSDDEFAAEVANQTVHGVLHLAWAKQADGSYQAQMAIYVKPRGVLGAAYMALITPLRHLVVYPALMGQIERVWNNALRSGACAKP